MAFEKAAIKGAVRFGVAVSEWIGGQNSNRVFDKDPKVRDEARAENTRLSKEIATDLIIGYAGGRILGMAGKAFGGKGPIVATEATGESISLTKKAFGHTFRDHGEEATEFLTNRAAGSGKANGQFLDNQAAASLINNNLGNLKSGAISVPMPEGFPARMINPDGSYGIPTQIRIVPSATGVKTAYPQY